MKPLILLFALVAAAIAAPAEVPSPPIIEQLPIPAAEDMPALMGDSAKPELLPNPDLKEPIPPLPIPAPDNMPALMEESAKPLPSSELKAPIQPEPIPAREDMPALMGDSAKLLPQPIPEIKEPIRPVPEPARKDLPALMVDPTPTELEPALMPINMEVFLLFSGFGDLEPGEKL